MIGLIPRAPVVSSLVAIVGGVIAVLAALRPTWWAIGPAVVVEVLLTVCAGIAFRRDGVVR